MSIPGRQSCENELASAMTLPKLLILFPALAVTVSLPGGEIARGFQPKCNLAPHFSRMNKFDRMCPAEGNSPDSRLREQSRIQNDFCAKGPAIPLSNSDFVEMQVVAERLAQRFQSYDFFPADRSVLRQIYAARNFQRVGEGSQVTLTGYVQGITHSLGQSAFCSQTGDENLPFYLAIKADLSVKDPCSGVVTEINPHLRPEAWAYVDLRSLQGSRAKVKVTGQLFYNSQARTCQQGRGGGFPRASAWQISPVYDIETCSQDGVCTSLAAKAPRNPPGK